MRLLQNDFIYFCRSNTDIINHLTMTEWVTGNFIKRSIILNGIHGRSHISHQVVKNAI